MGRVGYAPTTPAMSMQYSTIELTALCYILKISFLFSLMKKILVFSFTAYNIDKFKINKLILKSLKNAPDGSSGKKLQIKKINAPICK